MNPRLIVITGPLEGTVFPLGERLSIGRESDNLLRIKQASVSRYHCVIEKDEDGFKISDLSSFGTFINKIPVKDRVLEHGDQIAVGDTLLIFLCDEGETPRSLISNRLYEDNIVARSAISLRTEDALYLKPERILEENQSASRITKDLSILLKISTAISSIRNMEGLQRELLQSILAVTPSERGAILLVGESANEYSVVFSSDKLSGDNQPINLSHTVIRQTIQDGVAIFSNDVLETSSFTRAQSLINAGTRSLLCAPITSSGQVLGLIYLDSNSPTSRYDKGHLELVTAMASVAGLAIDNVRHVEWLKGENQRLQEEINLADSLVGDTPEMKDLYCLIKKVAPTDSSILIRGESGTGKELVARAIHVHSLRVEKPFIAINCATLTEALLESELFGHEKGAFTGAIARRKGKLEIADGRTVFLDEVGEISPQLQAKLLRVLQEREFERLGGNQHIKVEIRLIAATNRDLESAIQRGAFREDLYYRLNVIEILIPPLRERREDIPLLVNYFVSKYREKCNRRVRGVTPKAQEILMNWPWRGDVRELENVIERAIVLGSTNMITPDDLPQTMIKAQSSINDPVLNYKGAIKAQKEQLVISALKRADGNYTKAAKLLGMHPNNLYRLIRTIGLKIEPKDT